MFETSGPFALTAFFAGHVRATGIFEDRFGTVRRRFIADMVGRFEGCAFVMTEDFVFDDGEKQHRVWRITPRDDGSFAATANDIVGVATGVTIGSTIKMRYRHEVMIDGRAVVLSFDDQIHRLDRDNAIGRARVNKWGVKVGELSIFFQRVAAQSLEPKPVGFQAAA